MFDSTGRIPTLLIMENKTTLYETLWEAFEAGLVILNAWRAESREYRTYMHTGGIRYGETWKRTFPIERIRGRFTRMAYHVSIHRTEGGRYELVAYIL